MHARRSCLWLAIAAGSGACERCTWQLEYVEEETSSGAATLTGGGSADAATQGATETAGPDSAAATSDVAGLDLGGAQSGSSDGAEGTSTGYTGGTSPDGGSDGGTGPGSPTCGNGVIEPWEVCDDENFEDGDVCPSGQGGCDAPAICGDGFVWAGVEECDDGDEADEDECSNGCLAPRTVFVTENVYFGSELGGVYGADDECQKAAAAAGLSGEFRAWLSEKDQGPLYYWEVTGPAGLYKLTNGKPLALGWEALIDGTALARPLSVNEYGDYLPIFENAYVWTGTAAGGGADLNCGDWKIGGIGLVGRWDRVDLEWTEAEFRDCDATMAHLYCFEVPNLWFP